MAITGSIQQKNGKWYAVLNMKDINGKRKPKWIPTGYNARGNKKKAEDTKTESSRRVLPLTQQAYDLLMTQREMQIERSRVMGCYYYKSDYVCTWADGRVIQPNYLTKNFHQILLNSDLPMVRFHDLRHSTASNLMEQNVSIVNISGWLGHSSPTTTLNFYAHTNQEQKKRVANVIDDLISVR